MEGLTVNRAGRRVELRRGARSVAACVRVRAYLPLFRLYVLHALTRALGEVLVGAHRTSGNGVDPVVPNGQVSGKSCGSFLNKLLSPKVQPRGAAWPCPYTENNRTVTVRYWA